jgi:hypothetical protein
MTDKIECLNKAAQYAVEFSIHFALLLGCTVGFSVVVNTVYKTRQDNAAAPRYERVFYGIRNGSRLTTYTAESSIMTH